MGAKEKNPIYGCFKPVHWFQDQLNSRAWLRRSAPKAANNVVGTHSHPIAMISAIFHRLSVHRTIHRPQNTVARFSSTPAFVALNAVACLLHEARHARGIRFLCVRSPVIRSVAQPRIGCRRAMRTSATVMKK